MNKQKSSRIKINIRPVSRLRKAYIARLVGRCIILAGCIFLSVLGSSEFELLDGMNFFSRFSVLHILWGIWMIDMVCQLIPVKHMPLGSQKLFRERFRPVHKEINYSRLKDYIISTRRAACKIFALWTVLIAVIGALFHANIINRTVLFLISVFFYVCDLICVLVWCPFRLILGNRCCTTCRIFNWDHLMMFSPLVFMGGFYAISLFLMACAVWLVWEFCVMRFPERFWEFSNEALKCSHCTDKLCTQYCKNYGSS